MQPGQPQPRTAASLPRRLGTRLRSGSSGRRTEPPARPRPRPLAPRPLPEGSPAPGARAEPRGSGRLVPARGSRDGGAAQPRGGASRCIVGVPPLGTTSPAAGLQFPEPSAAGGRGLAFSGRHGPGFLPKYLIQVHAR